MNDQPAQPPSDEDAPPGNPNRAFLPIGITFVAVGISFLFSPSMATVGWTFLPVGVVFLLLGLTPRPKATAEEGDASPSRD